MKDSGVEWIGEIPENWSTCRIKNVATISNGKEIEVDGGNIPVYGSGGIFKYTDKPLFSGISLLLGRKGTIDKPMLVSGDFWTVDTMFYTSSIRQIVPKYLFYCAKSLICFDFFKSGSVLPSMTQTELNDVYITYPKTCIQTEIADYLEKSHAKAILFCQEKEEYSFFSGKNQEVFAYIRPITLRFGKEQRQIFVYTKEKAIMEKAEQFHQKKELRYTGVTVDMQGICVSESEKIRVLEGVLAATEKRLNDYIQAGRKNK